MRLLLMLTVLVSANAGHAQTKAMTKAWKGSPQAYALYTPDGNPASWSDLIDRAMTADVVFFGELHDDAVMHWLQKELVQNLLDKGLTPALGAEMLEADDQLVLDEYLLGVINKDKLKAAANLWPNYWTDYHPLVDMAKEHGLPFIATNIPRRYASFVYQHGLIGLDSLSDGAKAFLPALPIPFDINLPGYQAMLAMGSGHGGETLPMAQASKDATMAHFILSNLSGGQPFVHFNGAYHSQNREGISWYLKQSNPDLDIVAIHGHRQDNVLAPDSADLQMGDFLIITNERMTKTH